MKSARQSAIGSFLLQTILSYRPLKIHKRMTSKVNQSVDKALPESKNQSSIETIMLREILLDMTPCCFRWTDKIEETEAQKRQNTLGFCLDIIFQKTQSNP